MKKILSGLLAACILASAATAAPVAGTSSPGIVLFSGTSPAAPSTVAQTAVVGLDGNDNCIIEARLAGATGGPLDVYVQSSTNGGAAGSWYDVVHFPQLTAGAAAIGYVAAIGHGPVGTAPVVVNSVDGTPALAANTVVPAGLGNALRVVTVAGASTSAGASLTITAICSTL